MLTLLAAVTALVAPPALALPAPGGHLVASLVGDGVQTYRCDPARDGGRRYAWAFQAPQAILSDPSGRVVARHSAGPTWTATGGGAIVGQPLAKVKSPDGLGVDWLLLRVQGAPARSGLFAGVSYVRRLSTIGGVPVATGCTTATAGTSVSVPYSAVYEFYR